VKDGPSAADTLGEDFYKVILENEPFKSTKVCLQLLFCFSSLTKVVECVYTSFVVVVGGCSVLSLALFWRDKEG
jgi:hypothetical protein